MKREDLGFIVSRALAVWVAVVSVQSFVSFGYVLWEMASIPSDTSHSHEVRTLVMYIMSFAGEFGFAALLWTKADSFGRIGSQKPLPTAEPSVTEPDTHEASWMALLRPTLLGAIGLWTCLESVDSCVRSYLAHIAWPGTQRAIVWQPYAAQAAVGALIFIGFTYGDRIRAIFDYRD